MLFILSLLTTDQGVESLLPGSIPRCAINTCDRLPSICATKGAGTAGKVIRVLNVVDDVAKVGSKVDDIAKVGSKVNDVAKVDDAAKVCSKVDETSKVDEVGKSREGRRVDEAGGNVDDYKRIDSKAKVPDQ